MTRISVPLTERERRRVEKLARAYRMSLASMLHELAMEALARAENDDNDLSEAIDGANATDSEE